MTDTGVNRIMVKGGIELYFNEDLKAMINQLF